MYMTSPDELPRLIRQQLTEGVDIPIVDLMGATGLQGGGFFGRLGRLGLGSKPQRPTLADLEANETAHLTILNAMRTGGQTDTGFEGHVSDALSLFDGPAPLPQMAATEQPGTGSTARPDNDREEFWAHLEMQGMNIHRVPVSPFKLHEK